MTDATARFLSEKPRSRAIALEWPVEFGGKIYEAIEVRRMNTLQIKAFLELLEDDPAAATLPMFFHPDGDAVPPDILDQLDPDDALTLKAASDDFLPRAFRTEGEQT